MKRTFIAFDITPENETRAAYEIIRQKLRSENISWITDRNFHMTLKFLGDTPEDHIPGICKTIRNSLAEFSTFPVILAGVGLFKNIHDPKVLWMGCRADTTLENLKARLEKEMTVFGYELEQRRFSPHLTLGRIKQVRQVNQLTEVISMFRDKVFQVQEVKEIIYYESTLKPSGAVYTPIEVFRLGSQ
ncbi:MAG TPA: RNA 2',3'-cyclic phosphodiesterase [Bacteroidales bacterium]|nr:RNA 2',3'-cyclic phosphodiesterase [Bacteroidales bacterium]